MNIKSLTVIGGDKRQLAAAEVLSTAFPEVNIWGFENTECKKLNMLNDEELASNVFCSDAVVLPLPVSKDGSNLFASKALSLSRLVELIGKNKTVFAGMIDRRTKNSLERNGCTVFDYFRREDVAVKNAVPTAQGTLSIILSNIDYTADEIKACVTGYGKTAKVICAWLSALGAGVCVFARNPAARAEAESFNLKSSPIEKLKEKAGKYNVFVNTVPSLIISRDIIENMQKNALIIDIASAPFGTDFYAAKENGIKAVQAGSLPGKAAPATAGRIIAEAIIDTAGGD